MAAFAREPGARGNKCRDRVVLASGGSRGPQLCAINSCHAGIFKICRSSQASLRKKSKARRSTLTLEKEVL